MISGQWECDIAAEPTFDMESLARLKAEAIQRCSGPDFQFTLVKLVPLLVTKNAYTVFLLALAMLEFSKHIIEQIETLQPGQMLVQESSIGIKQPFSIADVLDLLEAKREELRMKGTAQPPPAMPKDMARDLSVSCGFAHIMLGDLIEDIRTRAGFPSPEPVTDAEN
jgi:hypothetical protein